MKKISQRKVTNDFLHVLFDINAVGWALGYGKMSAAAAIAAKYLLSLKADEIQKLVSDPVWDNYPVYKELPDSHERNQKYADEEFCQDRYGPIIHRVIERIVYSDHKTAMILAKNSRGLLLYVVLRNSYGEIADAGFVNAMRSSDPRVRNVAAKDGPIKYVDKMRFDSKSTVRSTAIKRVGINHCYKDHLNDPSKSIRSLAMLAAPLKDFDYNAVMTEIIERAKINNRVRWDDQKVAKSILSKMTTAEVLYYINLSSNDSSIKDILEFKMENIS